MTVHFVDAGVDSGPVILQGAVELREPGEPEQVLAALRPARALRCCPRPCGCSRAVR